VDFFQALSDSWAGWQGPKHWAALEGEYSLTATTDLTGHVTLTVELNPHGPVPGFCATCMLALEAGQLEQLLRRAKQFFDARA
jgi:hypothetical protein